nr:hypothetical protein [Erwinia typographi]
MEFRNDGTLRAPSSVYAGESHMSTDGNIYGAAWGGYLTDWITKTVAASAISGVRLSTETWTGAIENDTHNLEDGNVLTSVLSGRVRQGGVNSGPAFRSGNVSVKR